MMAFVCGGGGGGGGTGRPYAAVLAPLGVAPASAMALTVAMLAFASCEVVVFPLVVGLALWPRSWRAHLARCGERSRSQARP